MNTLNPTEASRPLLPPFQTGDPRGLLGAAAVAEFLSIGEAHFYNLKKAGLFGPHPVKMGRSVRYMRSELLAWAAAGAPDRRHWDGIRDHWLTKFGAA